MFSVASRLSTTFHVLVFLHVVCVVGGFGGLIYNGLGLDLARRRGAATTAGVLTVNTQISQLAEALIYGAFLTGIGAVAASGHAFSFSDGWVSAAMAIFVVMVGVRHGLIRPAERRFKANLLELASAPAVAPPNRPPQMDLLDQLQRRISVGWGVFNLLLLVALYLMVFRP
jgi:uncharacterized membrane protein